MVALKDLLSPVWLRHRALHAPLPRSGARRHAGTAPQALQKPYTPPLRLMARLAALAGLALAAMTVAAAGRAAEGPDQAAAGTEAAAAASKHRPSFGIEDDRLMLDGKPIQIISGRCVGVRMWALAGWGTMGRGEELGDGKCSEGRVLAGTSAAPRGHQACARLPRIPWGMCPPQHIPDPSSNPPRLSHEP